MYYTIRLVLFKSYHTFHLINRHFRSGRVIRHTTFSPVARQLLVFGTYDIYEKFSEDSNSAM